MKSKILGVIIIALILLGLGLIFYPQISFYYYNKDVDSIVKIQESKVESLNNESLEAEFAKAREYNESLLSGSLSDEHIDLYKSTLNINKDGVMGFVDIPKINVHLPIFHGTSQKVLENGAGHLENTSLPTGDINTNPVITAHTGHPRQKFFTDLPKLKKGDYFFLNVLGKKFAYKVFSKEIILPETTENLDLVEGKDMVTLLTCYPYGVNSHRLLIKGERTEIPKEMKKNIHSKKIEYSYILPAVIILILLIFFERRRNAKKKEKN